MTTDVDQLLTTALGVIDEAVSICRYAHIAPLFSGGHDSYCACFVASQHRKFDGNVYHINTGIGSGLTRSFVEEVCKDEGWKLNVLKSPETFERFIRIRGFPGPAMHQFAYIRLKDRCVDMITRHGRKHHNTILVTGCRSKESTRRMGHTKSIKIGEVQKDGKPFNKHRIWIAPCHDWNSEDQRDFMDYHRLLRNPVKESVLGMSGECFCGAFARPGELDMIRQVCPDVAIEIERLQVIAKECGKPCVWGQRPTKIVEILETGPLCTSCDLRAKYTGIEVKQS